MCKIELTLSKEELRQATPKTLKTIVNYLRSKNIKIKCYFELNSPNVILKYQTLEVGFKNSSDASKYLYDIYIKLQKQEQQEIIKRKILNDSLEKIGG